jgi:hopanoid biosynthesis associated protein HpnK
METSRPRRRLIVNADDFGLSHSVNTAVIRAHQEGILTTASLMVNEPGFDEAVALAREHPRLGVGLHLVLLCGHSTLPPQRIPGLVNQCGEFSPSPAAVGLRYFAVRSLRSQLEAEVGAQVDKFHRTGLRLDHVNGHLHLHLHPVVFDILIRNAARWGIERMRLTRDSFWLNATLARGRWFYRTSHTVIFGWLCARAERAMQRLTIRHTGSVFGLLQQARVDEDYIARLLPNLPSGDSELYSHPSLDEFKHEFAALISPRVKLLARNLGIELIRYQDL